MEQIQECEEQIDEACKEERKLQREEARLQNKNDQNLNGINEQSEKRDRREKI